MPYGISDESVPMKEAESLDNFRTKFRVKSGCNMNSHEGSSNYGKSNNFFLYLIRVKVYNGPANKFKDFNGPAYRCLIQRHHRTYPWAPIGSIKVCLLL